MPILNQTTLSAMRFGLLFAITLGFTAALRAADEKTADAKVGEITLKVPADWKSEEPSSSMRLAQFRIPKADGDTKDAELAVFTFGGGGGGLDANLKRWVNEFQAEGRKSKVTKGKSELGTYYVADLTGTMNQRIGPPIAGKTQPVPGTRSLGIVLDTGKTVYYLKLFGPEKTVTAAATGFRASFGGLADKEEEYKLPE